MCGQRHRHLLLALGFVGRCRAHAILSEPVPRTNIVAPGNKLTPFQSAGPDANCGCGGAANNDVGVQTPTAVYQPGLPMQVKWTATIPHDADITNSGVRIALHYGPGDSFAQNVLIGGVAGEAFLPLPAHAPGAAPNTEVTTLVTVPAGKTCDYCTIQFLWAAQDDGGYYVSCADIAITATGLLPNFAALPPERDTLGRPNELPGGPGACAAAGGGGGGAAVAVIVVLLLAVLVGGGGYYYKRRRSAGGPSGAAYPPSGASMVPVPPAAPASSLPAGWQAATDPASGEKYYVNSATGQTSWEPPQAPRPPAPPGGGPGQLPAGWQSATDPSSGRTYYVKTATGETSWDTPGFV